MNKLSRFNVSIEDDYSDPFDKPKVGDWIECLSDVGSVTNSPWTHEILSINENGFLMSDDSGNRYQIPEDMFTKTYTSENGNKVFVVEKEKPIIVLEGFEDPEDHAYFTLGIEADFINPFAEIITMETQQIEEAIKKKIFESVFLFKPTKPNLFSLGEAAVKASKAPEKTIFILNERDLDALGDEANVARNVITMLKDQKVGIFNNMAEAKSFVQKQLSGDLIQQPEQEIVDVKDLKDTV